VEVCDELWSQRSNATALAGFAITTMTTNLRNVILVADGVYDVALIILNVVTAIT